MIADILLYSFPPFADAGDLKSIQIILQVNEEVIAKK
jgi:hypothetical protein